MTGYAGSGTRAPHQGSADRRMESQGRSILGPPLAPNFPACELNFPAELNFGSPNAARTQAARAPRQAPGGMANLGGCRRLGPPLAPRADFFPLGDPGCELSWYAVDLRKARAARRAAVSSLKNSGLLRKYLARPADMIGTHPSIASCTPYSGATLRRSVNARKQPFFLVAPQVRTATWVRTYANSMGTPNVEA